MLLVPLCTVLFPFLAVALGGLIALLAMTAAWMQEASRRNTVGAVVSLRRVMSGEPLEPQPTIANPVSNFALYVNTTALVWFFGYMMLEVGRAWYSPCDVPLHSYVSLFAVTGIALSVADFLRAIFKDPMPPITKLEQSYARVGQQRRMVAYSWLTGAVVLWGLFGLACLSRSTTCAGTAPQLYRLSLLLSFVFCCLIAAGLLVLVGVGIDYCCSGKLRIAIVLER